MLPSLRCGPPPKNSRSLPISYTIALRAEQRRIVAEVERLLRLAGAVEARVERAAAQAEQMRQALPAKAFRGELG